MKNEESKRHTLIIPDRLWRAAKIQAIREGRTLTELVEEAFEAYLPSGSPVEARSPETAIPLPPKARSARGAPESGKM